MLGWLGWTIVYAVVVWGIDAAYALLERWLNVAGRRVQGVAAGVRFLLPLGVAFLIGLQLRTWWWALSPFLVIVVTMLAFATVDFLRRPGGTPAGGRGVDPGDWRNRRRCRHGHPRRRRRGGDRPLVAWRLSGTPLRPLFQIRLGGRELADPSRIGQRHRRCGVRRRLFVHPRDRHHPCPRREDR